MRYLLPLLAAALCAASCSTVRRAARTESARTASAPAAKAPGRAFSTEPVSAKTFSAEAFSAEAWPGGSSSVRAGAEASAAAGEAPVFDECLLISKAAMKLSVLDGEGRPLLVVPIACGENYGDKRRAGDRRTPEGLFTVQEILDTSRWPVPAPATEAEAGAAAETAEAGPAEHAEAAKSGAAAEEAKAETAEAGKAPAGRTKRQKREKAAARPAPKAPCRSPYGPYFIRLLTPPHEGIGIHGTNDEASIGSRASAGCIRLHNDDLRRLLRYVRIGMPVFITPSECDEAADAADVGADKAE